MCHYNRNTHNVAFCIFSCRSSNNFYKLLVIIVTCNEKKRIDHISKIVSMVFLLKTLLFFFQMKEKLEMCRNSNLIYSKGTSFGDEINVTLIS